ncbi:MAG: hypothetical protein KO318_11680 [Methanobacterium sp.]|jgi:hypothetical protein|nr:hypothetical protein [Methanobacterium sp.]MCC7561067.1 hypothetical protein [Methanobacterium sp.]
MTDAFLEQMNISVVPFGRYDAIKAAHSAMGNGILLKMHEIILLELQLFN